jgi:3-hydroxyacyl-[acyl-carrier-protein] dehydratase
MEKIHNSRNHNMAKTAHAVLETKRPFPGPAKASACGVDRCLRESLKRCSASTYEAVCQFRKTADPEHLPAIVLGVIDRYVEPALQARLKHPDDELRLAEDLGIDSLSMMEIVMLAEEVFQISIKNEELCHLRTLGEARRFIECKVYGLPLPTPARLLVGDLVLE